MKSAKNASTVDTTCAATQGMPGDIRILAIGLGCIVLCGGVLGALVPRRVAEARRHGDPQSSAMPRMVAKHVQRLPSRRAATKNHAQLTVRGRGAISRSVPSHAGEGRRKGLSRSPRKLRIRVIAAQPTRHRIATQMLAQKIAKDHGVSGALAPKRAESASGRRISLWRQMKRMAVQHAQPRPPRSIATKTLVRSRLWSWKRRWLTRRLNRTINSMICWT